jgi:dinuclear metal center YbgI/SA1388 family protein
MKIKELTDYIEEIAPKSLQESYDNAGLLVGDLHTEISGVLICLDVTEDVVEEAVRKKANLIISHHPIIFKGLKRLTGHNYVERTVISAIQNRVAIYAAHTNLDNTFEGVNLRICEKIGLTNCRILVPTQGKLRKIITFVPQAHAEQLRNVLWKAGAGGIGNYDACSFNIEGAGTFRAGESANPFVGEIGKIHTESEIRVEMIFPDYLEKKIISALYSAHPYEEPAFDIFKLENHSQQIGAGMIGELENKEEEMSFLYRLKDIFSAQGIRYTRLLGKPIKRIALCGGSGSFLLQNAISAKADIYISSDFKYHEFFDAQNEILIADIGHFESEQFTKELFYEILTKKKYTFACFLSEINTNPINYLK